jgi:hypothetical protein
MAVLRCARDDTSIPCARAAGTYTTAAGEARAASAQPVGTCAQERMTLHAWTVSVHACEHATLLPVPCMPCPSTPAVASYSRSWPPTRAWIDHGLIIGRRESSHACALSVHGPMMRPRVYSRPAGMVYVNFCARPPRMTMHPAELAPVLQFLAGIYVVTC